METKIIFNGKQYASPEAMPEEVRQAYQQAMAEVADAVHHLQRPGVQKRGGDACNGASSFRTGDGPGGRESQWHSRRAGSGFVGVGNSVDLGRKRSARIFRRRARTHTQSPARARTDHDGARPIL